MMREHSDWSGHQPQCDQESAVEFVFHFIDLFRNYISISPAGGPREAGSFHVRVYCYLVQQDCSAPVQPNHRTLEGNLDPCNLAIVCIIDLRGSEADGCIRISHDAHQKARFVIEI